MPPELDLDHSSHTGAHAVRVLAAQRLMHLREHTNRFLRDVATALHDLRVALRRLRSSGQAVSVAPARAAAVRFHPERAGA
jgi:CHAD domain-containing protein